MGKRLSSIQWQLIRYAFWISLVSTISTLIIVFSVEHISVNQLFFDHLWVLPYGIFIILSVILFGFVFGYLFGNTLKKRIETLVTSILRFEKGNYSERVPEMGEDEVGQVAFYLNRMAEQIERQVASLQKLSSEKAKWNEELMEAVVTGERHRLARELHDAVSQQLFAISMLSSAVKETHDKNPEMTGRQLEIIEKMAGQAQNEMRALLLHLRPAQLEGKGLKEGIEALLTEFHEKQPIGIHWKIEDVRGLPKGVEDHLFRIVQEALSNILRHSKADNVFVRLDLVNRQIRMKITDNGVGFDPSETRSSSYGLTSIQERVNNIGGVAEIISWPKKGTQIDVKIPLVDEVKA